MDSKQTRTRPARDAHEVTRREALLAGSGGLALALFTLSAVRARAQEATPSPGGMPEGVTIEPGVTVGVADMPAAPVAVAIYRITIEPGATVPNSTFPFPTIVVVEQGTLTCPGGAPRYVIKPDGTTTEYGDEDITVNVGEAIYVPTNVLDGARNDGTEQIILLAVDMMPGEAMGTPTA